MDIKSPRYTFAHSQTIYGSLVETRGPYLRHYMNFYELLSKFILLEGIGKVKQKSNDLIFTSRNIRLAFLDEILADPLPECKRLLK